MILTDVDLARIGEPVRKMAKAKVPTVTFATSDAQAVLAEITGSRHVINALQTYLTADSGVVYSADGDPTCPAEDAFAELVAAFRAYRPDVRLPGGMGEEETSAAE